MTKQILTVFLIILLGGCGSNHGCDEWTTREVVDYNFCNGNLAAEQAGAAQMPGAGRCVGPGTQARVYCVKRPRVDGEPVNH